MDGSFVINFGKMMEHFTYGVIKATLHRVRNTHDRMRVSWPLFLGPNLNRDLVQLIEFKWNEGKRSFFVNQFNVVPLRSSKTGRFEKMVSFDNSHPIVTRGSRVSRPPPHHTSPRFSKP